MIVFKQRRTYSKLQDEDYYDDLKRDMEEATTNKHVSTVGGSALGGLLGAAAPSGSVKRSIAQTGLGLAAGGLLGYKIGRHNEKIAHEEGKRKRKIYEKSSEKDRAYLRHRAEKNREEKLRREQIRATRDVALATLW